MEGKKRTLQDKVSNFMNEVKTEFARKEGEQAFRAVVVLGVESNGDGTANIFNRSFGGKLSVAAAISGIIKNHELCKVLKQVLLAEILGEEDENGKEENRNKEVGNQVQDE